ncbi:MAG: hypothetical protein GY711_09800 [bacterium]|nr:hypothetical protein [bacterium]
MNIHDALENLDTIQEQLSRSTPVRGYRAATVARTAALGAVGAAAQAVWVGEPLAERRAYLGLWVGLALVGVLALTFEVGRRFVLTRSRHERHGLLRTLFTLAPAFGTAAVLTVAFATRSDELFALLPGLWMLCFALAIFASVPRLPQGVGFVACFYFAAGAWTLGQPAAVALSPWTMGAVFGLGQAWAAGLLACAPEGAEFPLDRRGDVG